MHRVAASGLRARGFPAEVQLYFDVTFLTA